MTINSKEIRLWYSKYLGKDIANTYLVSSGGKIELSAAGIDITADDGKVYRDFAGGYGVFSLGHTHPEVCAAVADQLQRMPMSSRAMINPLAAELGYALINKLPGNEPRTVYFCNGGSEAVEAALKLAIAATGRSRLIAIEGAFHGKTLGSLATMAKYEAREPFLQVLHANVGWIPREDFQLAKEAITSDVAAVILEPVQGEGGIHCLSPGYLSMVSHLCSEYGVLLIADEIQCGLGRTGKFSYTEYASHCQPDIFCLGKALGGGVMPIAATIYNQQAGRGIRGKPTLLTNTFGGGQLACAAAVKTLEIIERDKLADRARTLGEIFTLGLLHLKDHYLDLIEDVRGIGLMIGIEYRDASANWSATNVAGRVIMEAFKRGVLLAPALSQHRVTRIEPPLIIEPTQIEDALAILDQSLAATREAVAKG